MTGFLADSAAGTVFGRPVSVAQLPDGSLLVADDPPAGSGEFLPRHAGEPVKVGELREG